MKKVLMIAPFFFEYEIRIKQELEKKGYVVKLYDDKSNLSLKGKIFTKIFNQDKLKLNEILKRNNNKHFENILKNESNEKYDIIFIINGQYTPNWFYEKLKKINNNSEWIYYIWDDIENCEEILEIEQYFNKKFTYSELDSNKYGYIYRPFFFTEELTSQKENDVYFLGTNHSDREEVLIKILKELTKKMDLKIEAKLLTGKWSYLKKIKSLNRSKLYTLKKTNYKTFIKNMSKSKIAIEIPYPNQFTTTTRAIESIGTKTKIITTVQDVKNKEFYDENNFLIIDRKNPKIDENWIKKPYRDLSYKIKEKYTLSKWIEEVFE